MTGAVVTADATRLIEEASLFLAEQDASGAAHEWPRPTPQRILLPYTGSPSSQSALDAVTKLSSGLFAEVWVLHVREWEMGMGRRWYRESREEAIAVTRRALDRLQGDGVGARGIVRQAVCSRVAEEIADKADQLGVGAIVLGARPRRLISWLFVRSVSRRVTRIANCPVLLVRCERAKRGERRGRVAGEKRHDDAPFNRRAA